MLDLLITIIIISKRVNNHFLNELQEINESKNSSLEAIYLMEKAPNIKFQKWNNYNLIFLENCFVLMNDKVSWSC